MPPQPMICDYNVVPQFEFWLGVLHCRHGCGRVPDHRHLHPKHAHAAGARRWRALHGRRRVLHSMSARVPCGGRQTTVCVCACVCVCVCFCVCVCAHASCAWLNILRSATRLQCVSPHDTRRFAIFSGHRTNCASTSETSVCVCVCARARVCMDDLAQHRHTHSFVRVFCCTCADLCDTPEPRSRACRPWSRCVHCDAKSSRNGSVCVCVFKLCVRKCKKVETKQVA